MKAYLIENPVTLVMGVLFVIVFAVTTFFLISANNELRHVNSALLQENKSLVRKNEKLHADNATLMLEVQQRDKRIAQATLVYDSLHNTLQQLNNKKIITNYETHSVVRSLDLDGQLRLLTDFLSRADSIER